MAYFGIYRATVTNAHDPTMKGQVRVSVPSAAAASGWAAPCREYKSIAVPPVGTVVWVMFEGGNPASPVWLGCMA